MPAKQRSSPTRTQCRYKGLQLRILVLMASLSLACATPSSAQLYQWTDPQGTLHLGNDAGEVAEASRRGLAVYPVGAAQAGGKSAAAPLSPSRLYTAQSQGAFAQRLAQDLGLIKQSDEDALGPLSGVGITPTGYWRVTEPLTAAVVEELVAATRRAAAARGWSSPPMVPKPSCATPPWLFCRRPSPWGLHLRLRGEATCNQWWSWHQKSSWKSHRPSSFNRRLRRSSR